MSDRSIAFNQPSALIVEDNPFNRELLKRVLNAQKLQVMEAKNGKEALSMIRVHPFTMIFMDLLMPGMDGYETIERIRRMGVQTPIIIVSSMSSKEDRRRCLDVGGDEFLPKPIDARLLRDIAERYAAGRPADRPGDGPPLPANGEKEYPVEKQSLSLSSFSALLVEEDRERALRYKRFLEARFMEVAHVANGDQAIAIFEKNRHRFRIIVSNIFTTGIDGLGVLARFKREYPDVFFFIYADEYDADAFQLAVQLGADGVLTADRFEEAIEGMIESAIFQAGQRGSRLQSASTATQVRQAQAHLIRQGCSSNCGLMNIAYSPLSDAGGDIACCRRFNLAGRCGVFLGDVAGHNVLSSYVSAFYMGILTANWGANQRPRELLKMINSELNRSDYDQYHLCASALLWDQRRGTLRIASAGNPGPLVVRPQNGENRIIRDMEGGGMCLGLLDDEDLFLSDLFSFDPGDYLFIFSDGMERSRLIELLTSDSDILRGTLGEIGQRIVDRTIERWGQEDDMILITLKAPNPDLLVEKGCHFSFSDGYKGVDRACGWVRQTLEEKGRPVDRDLYLVMIAVREALINAVCHGNRMVPGAYVDLDLLFEADRFCIRVSDGGPGVDLPREMVRIEEIDVLQTGGRGISAMRSIADEITLEGGTLTICFNDR